MRNIRKEAETLLGESQAVLPDEVKAAAAAYALREHFTWWENAFLLDELEKIIGVVLHSRALVQKQRDIPARMTHRIP
ncbi:MAG TPA: hypothetical protein VK558_08805 [Patescibacteria group bacterium]|nr:hypothetical protein [Patescibacteria group bacterium]